MKYLLLLIAILSSLGAIANDPSKPLIKKDTISYIKCYVIDTRDGSAYAPYTFFKIGNKYYEGVAFPFRNSDCIENFTNTQDSFKVNYESTIDFAGEQKIYDLAEKMEVGMSYDSLKAHDITDLVTCIKNSRGMPSDVFQFIEIRFIASYYIIRCDKPRNCSGPDIVCTEMVDIDRSPVFTKIQTILK